MPLAIDLKPILFEIGAMGSILFIKAMEAMGSNLFINGFQHPLYLLLKITIINQQLIEPTDCARYTAIVIQPKIVSDFVQTVPKYLRPMYIAALRAEFSCPLPRGVS